MGKDGRPGGDRTGIISLPHVLNAVCGGGVSPESVSRDTGAVTVGVLWRAKLAKLILRVRAKFRAANSLISPISRIRLEFATRNCPTPRELQP